MFEFILPDLGEGIHEGELIQWHVTEGDSIREDDPLCDMETDKAAVTIPSPRSGVIFKLNGRPGQIISVGAVLAVIKEPDKDENKPGSSAVSAPSHPQVAPQAASPAGPAFQETAAARKEPARKKAAAAPATRRLAREMGIDINTIIGTGPGGRVTKEDLKKTDQPAAGAQPAETVPGHEKAPSPPDDIPASIGSAGIPFFEYTPLPDFAAQGPVKKAPIRSLRRKTAIKTTTSMTLIPHVAHMDECDVTQLETVRKTFNRENPGPVKLTLMAFLIRALAALLKEYPAFNASVDPEKMEIIYKSFFNIGFAADTPRGLMVPVIKNADQLSVTGIAGAIQELAQKGREGTITPPELSHGTFSVTNVGAVGGTGIMPAINYPESAILGLGRMTKKPVIKDNDIVIRQMLPITLSFDHRVADGVRAAQFIGQLKQMLEDPAVFMTGI